MRKINAFLALFTISMISLIVLVVVSFYLFTASTQYPWNWMWMHMGGMMGGNYQVPAQNPVSPYVGVLFIGLIILTAVGAFGLIYFLAFPEEKLVNQLAENRIENFQGNLTTPYSAVLKALTPEERKIIEILRVHNGRYLQKYLRKEAGLTRLKTHRILSRLSERGLLTLIRVGNTNEVVLADWLTQQPKSMEKEN
jgi:hypothetical protein